MTAKKWPSFNEFSSIAGTRFGHRDNQDYEVGAMWAYEFLSEFAAPEVPGEVVSDAEIEKLACEYACRETFGDDVETLIFRDGFEAAMERMK